MRPLSVTELLAAWERGLDVPPTERALTLLAACSTEAPDALARLSIGRRDARLLALRELTFGAQLTSLAACPACGETSHPFGCGGAEAAAAEMGVPFLGRLPLSLNIREASDAGQPPAASNGPEAEAFAAAWAVGQAWTIEEAVSAVLQETPDA